MSELKLSPEARNRLWQCYALLLRLAEEAEKKSTGEGASKEDRRLAAATEATDSHRYPKEAVNRETEQEITEQVVSQDHQRQIRGQHRLAAKRNET